MKDKIVSMAPFFVILLIILIWGFMQGWFSPTQVVEAPTIETPPAPTAARAMAVPTRPAPRMPIVVIRRSSLG